MKKLTPAIVLLSLIIPACAPESPQADVEEPDENEDEVLGSTASPLFLDTTNSTTRYSKCEGYTSGGGQRVRGEVVLDTYAFVQDGVTKYQHYIDVKASNWIKNIFGWNTKRTGQLRIEGYVYASTLSTPTETFYVDYDTGGELETKIGGRIWTSPVTINWYASADVFLTFYGRDGTVCTLQ